MDLLSLLNLKTFLAFVATFLVCYLYLSRRRQRLPPGPWALPFIGNALWFMKRASSPDRPAELFLKASKTYGELVYFKLGRQGMLIVHGYEAIQDFFVTHADTFSDRPHWISQTPLKDGRGMVWESGEDWKKIRKFALQSLREFGVGKISLEEKIIVEVEAASKILMDQGQKPYDIRGLIRSMIANVIYGIVFGKRFDYDDGTFKELLKKISVIFKQGGSFEVTNRLPNFILKAFFGRDKIKDAERRNVVVNEIKDHINTEIAEHEETFDPDHIRDFIDKYIENKQAGEDKHLFTAGNMYKMIMDLFLAGTDTTTYSIIWSVLYMVEYPHVQKRCQEELQQKYGHQTILWSHRSNLTYVEATLLEIQRTAGIGEMSVPHTNDKEVTMRGYTIPRHTLVNANLLSCNLDPRYYEHPDRFEPERFIENGRIKKHPHLMPFSTGPRSCPGEALAKMELFLVFTNFLQRFTFSREDPNVAISFAKDKKELVSQPFPFKIRITPRM